MQVTSPLGAAINSDKYSAPSCPACIHPGRVIWDAQDCAYQQWAKHLCGFFSFALVRHVPDSAVCVDEALWSYLVIHI